MAKESLNKIDVAGKIVEIEAREGLNRSNKEYIAGTVKIEAGPDNIVPIGFYANKIKNDGNSNPMFASLKTVAAEYKTITANTREEADSVEVNGARVTENVFYSQDGTLIRGFQISSPFFNRKASVEPKAEFVITGEIVSIVEEPVENEIHIILRLLVVGYGDRANLIDFKVENPKAVDYVKNVFSVGQEVKVSGKVVIEETVVQKTEETAFGSPIITESKKFTRKMLVTAATPPIDSTIDSAERQTMLAAREGMLSEAKAKASSVAKAAPVTAANFTL